MISMSSGMPPDGPSSSDSPSAQPRQSSSSSAPGASQSTSTTPSRTGNPPPSGVNSLDGRDHEQDLARTRDLIESIASCSRGYYCTLKAYLCQAARPSRDLLKIKCVEKLRYERGDLHKHSITWKDIVRSWFEEGFDAAFEKHFVEGIDLEKLYQLIKNEPSPPVKQESPSDPKGLIGQLARGYVTQTGKPPEVDHSIWLRKHERLVERIAGCSCGHYCTHKEILFTAPHTARTLLQFKCTEKLKYERGKWYDRPVDWNEAGTLWAREGYAARFASFYSMELHHDDLYCLVMGR